VAEGPELLRAALEAGWPIEQVLLDPEAHKDAAIAALIGRASSQGISVVELRPGLLAQVADASTPQPVAAVAAGCPEGLGSLPPAVRFVLVADQVQDPGNLGALVRVAEACGADALLLTGRSADPFGPKALRGSTGSTFRLPVLEELDAAAAITKLQTLGLTVATTTPHGGADFALVDWPDRLALVLGNEAQGLEPSLLASGELAVRIPMARGVESLNLSVAAGILAMSVHRRLRAPEDGRRGSTIGAMPTPEQP
jgi:TrmH family RNA methyltransferase